jgi:hypothetical protein
VRAAGVSDSVEYRHVRAHEDRLLALPDVVAWCWVRSREWRRRVAPIVNSVRTVGPEKAQNPSATSIRDGSRVHFPRLVPWAMPSYHRGSARQAQNPSAAAVRRGLGLTSRSSSQRAFAILPVRSRGRPLTVQVLAAPRSLLDR